MKATMMTSTASMNTEATNKAKTKKTMMTKVTKTTHQARTVETKIPQKVQKKT